MKQVDEQIAATTQALTDARSNQFAETSTNINPTWQAADQDLNEKKAALPALQAKRAGIAAALSKLQADVKNTEGQVLDFKSLEHEAADAESNFQLYSQKRDAAQMADAMDAHALLNIAVVQAPTFSLTPVHPRPLIDSLLATFSALFIGAFAVFLAESGRKTFATPFEVEQVSALPVLATVPLSKALPEEIASLKPPPSVRVSVLTQTKRTKQVSAGGVLRLFAILWDRRYGRAAGSAA